MALSLPAITIQVPSSCRLRRQMNERERGCGDTPRPGRGTASPCTPCYIRMPSMQIARWKTGRGTQSPCCIGTSPSRDEEGWRLLCRRFLAPDGEQIPAGAKIMRGHLGHYLLVQLLEFMLRNEAQFS